MQEESVNEVFKSLHKYRVAFTEKLEKYKYRVFCLHEMAEALTSNSGGLGRRTARLKQSLTILELQNQFLVDKPFRRDTKSEGGQKLTAHMKGERRKGEMLHNYRWETSVKTSRLTVLRHCRWAWPPSGCSEHSPPPEGATSLLQLAACPHHPERR